MGKKLHILGLGPAGLEQLTLGSYRLLQKADKVFMRTARHPCAEELREEGIRFESFDEMYESGKSFEEVYEGIISRLRHELVQNEEIIYAVPGHPNVAERTVRLLVDKLSPECELIIHPGLSFLDEIFRAVSFDPIEGVSVLSQEGLKTAGIDSRQWLIIPQVYDKLVASEIKLDLMRAYPDEAEVMVVKALGSKEPNVLKCPLYELDHQEFDHLTTVVVSPNSESYTYGRLVEIMEILRSPDGCPWDREQTHVSLKPYVIEEAYEVIEAIENQDVYNLCEELGDLLLQVIFHAQVAAEAGEFDMTDVLHGIITKLVRRHPHVFGEGKAATAREVIRTWEQIKAEEKAQNDDKTRFFEGSKGLPALMWAQRTQRQAAKVGFDWPDWNGAWVKVQEECRELEQALREDHGIREEMGDLLFAVVNLARLMNFDAEEVLRETVRKFQHRFDKMMEFASQDGNNLGELSLEQLDVLWKRAKLEEKNAKLA
ncbi:bifunctional methyltransferase/pyrophosphohydrolase YabN [Paradesulfitobacterium ferrireducens]|uniref:nucleoside triphosphate pyrophosphohydrolase n=1 Tax=Paradesulfitobacterium ferrireducens TaxID=2816476 RepID=UPI001A8EDDCE|nr:nucleoside triphosphate pyrophosphohydrolase [Paradesulfitobacterium ferrireducens]